MWCALGVAMVMHDAMHFCVFHPCPCKPEAPGARTDLSAACCELDGESSQKSFSPPSLPPIIRVCGLGFNRGFAGGALEMHACVFFVGFGGELSESRPCLHEFWLSVPYAGFCVSLSWARPIRFALV